MHRTLAGDFLELGLKRLRNVAANRNHALETIDPTAVFALFLGTILTIQGLYLGVRTVNAHRPERQALELSINAQSQRHSCPHLMQEGRGVGKEWVSR